MNRAETLAEMLKRIANTFTRYALALEYQSVNEHEKAEKEFEHLLKNAPDYLATYYRLGKLKEEKGEIEEARELYEKGMEVASRRKIFIPKPSCRMRWTIYFKHHKTYIYSHLYCLHLIKTSSR